MFVRSILADFFYLIKTEGFYLQAKMVMGEIVNKQFSLGNFAQAIAAYPESVWVTSFFAVFGLVIAIMKDVPGLEYT